MSEEKKALIAKVAKMKAVLDAARRLKKGGDETTKTTEEGEKA